MASAEWYACAHVAVRRGCIKLRKIADRRQVVSHFGRTTLPPSAAHLNGLRDCAHQLVGEADGREGGGLARAERQGLAVQL